MNQFVTIILSPWVILFKTLLGESPKLTLRTIVNNPLSVNPVLLFLFTLLSVYSLIRITNIVQVPSDFLVQGKSGEWLFFGILALLGSIATFILYHLFCLSLGKLKFPENLETPLQPKKVLIALLGSFIFFSWMNFPGIGAFAFVFGWLFRYLTFRTRLELSRENSFFLLTLSLIIESIPPAIILWSFRVYTFLTL